MDHAGASCDLCVKLSGFARLDSLGRLSLREYRRPTQPFLTTAHPGK